MSNSDGSSPKEGSLFPQLEAMARDGLDLLRLEVDLARQETIEKLTPAAQSSGMIIGGGLLAAWGSGYIADAIVRALATLMPHWLASLVFGAGITAGGLALIGRGSRNLQQLDLTPHKTIQSLKEDQVWLQDQIKSRLI